MIADTDLRTVLATLEQVRPEVCVIESVHTLHSDELASAAEAALDRAIDAALPHHRAKAAVRWLDAGDPVSALTRRRDWQERLVVIGAHHRDPLRPLGSVTARVVGRGPAPVAVVRERRSSRSGRVVVGVDGSQPARDALQWAAGYAERADAKVEAVLVEPDGSTVRDLPERLLGVELGHLRPREAARTYGLVHHGDAADVLREVAADADVLVVGSRGRGMLAGRFLGSVSQQLVRSCPTPVIVVAPRANA